MERLIPLGENPFTEDRFTTKTFVYKQVQDVPIHVDAYIPKHLSSDEKHPLFVMIHGGSMVDGARNVPLMTYGPWAAAFALAHNAIVLSPDYRLCPETKSPEIVKDLIAFWEWTHSTPALPLDLDRIIVRGESAGGWCALQLGLRFPTRIRALILAWTLTDPGIEEFVLGNGGRAILPGVFDVVVPREAFKVAWAKAKAKEAAGRVVAGLRLERTELMLGLVQYGGLVEAMGDFEESFPLRTIREGKGKLPSLVWVSQGEDDSIVPVNHAREFVEAVRASCPDSRVVLDVRPGDHGFDDMLEYGDPWLQERLEMIAEAWLA
ncbi:hypothetical protein PRZ48_014108 [Zasmidium cellare]|uniref:Alpha/beta hydrolase fold-3 domain-containing protein n=1 Tax=Zasmidium cellare TaxID=395010 RepID=A0ABR0E005_ZASCE|nr:hypothetical protein PRZ48_014108 [Zasmidium cellare]